MSDYAKVFARSLLFLWVAAPKETVLMTMAILLQGIVPALSVWITQLVVDAVSTALTEGTEVDYTFLITLVSAWIGGLLLETILTPWVSFIQSNLNDKLTAHVSLFLIRKADTFADLSRFEDSKFYDELQMLQQQVNYQPLSLLQSLAEGGRTLVTLITMIGLLIPGSPKRVRIEW